MKKTLLVILPALLLLIISCSKKKEQSFLNANQHALLDVPETGRMLTFNENGQLFTIEMGVLDIGVYKQDERKGGMITPSTVYYGEFGYMEYILPNGYNKLYIKTHSESSRGPLVYAGEQTIAIYNNDYTSSCNIDFSNKLAAKEIGGVTYSNVVLGIDSYKQDTLYWKKGLGVLGWKRKNENYTVYRVN